ncbi:hypothetical protein TSAR_013773 [Trichomalopsis sarcophagae]|uniref:Uncharacterized protein n=1 Tax=Trichomalopsis sarcophagae TaxID=543379 RepID=A0A232FMX7_9HYME|nr:hypothetical protein TSAR_013773 [Trichomalopsis sarcophagae]
MDFSRQRHRKVAIILLHVIIVNIKRISTTVKKWEKKSNIFEINRRSVLSMRLVGGGLENFPCPIQNATFTKIRNVLFEVTSRVADKFMSEAVDEELRFTRTNSQNEICEPESVNPEAISQLSIEDLNENIFYNGVFTILGQESGKIIDLEVLSSYCLQCNQYEKVHKQGVIQKRQYKIEETVTHFNC